MTEEEYAELRQLLIKYEADVIGVIRKQVEMYLYMHPNGLHLTKINQAHEVYENINKTLSALTRGLYSEK